MLITKGAQNKVDNVLFASSTNAIFGDRLLDYSSKLGLVIHCSLILKIVINIMFLVKKV
jgi:hypothetical protein